MRQLIIDHLHVVLLAIQSVLHHESTAHIIRVDILQIMHNFVCFIALIEALKLNDFKKTFPKFKGMPMSEHAPSLNELEVDLLSGLVALDPNRRISALAAL